MPIQKYTAKVSEIIVVGGKFINLKAELVEPNTLEFTAGQYIILDVPNFPLKKSYSIAAEPENDHSVELLFDTPPKGASTTYLNSLKLGDTISFMAPAGRFTVAAQDTPAGQAEKSLVFIATGTGITPVRSMVLDLLQNKNDQRRIILYWGLRHEDHIHWLEEFRELQLTFPNFEFHVVLSQASDAWTMCRGRVTDCLSIHPMLDSAGYYICGNKQMIIDVQTLLLQKNILPEHIHHEEFT